MKTNGFANFRVKNVVSSTARTDWRVKLISMLTLPVHLI